MNVLDSITSVFSDLFVGLAAVFGREKKTTPELEPDKQPEETELPPNNTKPPEAPQRKGTYQWLATEDITAPLRAELDESFGSSWPISTAAARAAKPGELVVVAVGSVPTLAHPNGRQELIALKVEVNQEDLILARIQPPVMFTHDNVAGAGHGLAAGDAVGVPHRFALAVGAESENPTPVDQLKPYEIGGPKVHTVRPGVPYHLVLPYRGNKWFVDPPGSLRRNEAASDTLQLIEVQADPELTDLVIRLLKDDVFVARWTLKVQHG